MVAHLSIHEFEEEPMLDPHNNFHDVPTTYWEFEPKLLPLRAKMEGRGGQNDVMHKRCDAHPDDLCYV
jgi:hypothetical protein